MERRAPIAPLLAAVLVLALAGPALAAEPGAQPADAQSAAQEPTKTFEPMQVLGMQVHIDPKTGEMRAPTPEEAAALSAQMQQLFGAAPLEQPAAVEHEDGTISLELGFSQMDFSVVRIAPGGTPVFDCVDGAQAAATLAETPAPTRLGPEEE